MGVGSWVLGWKSVPAITCHSTPITFVLGSQTVNRLPAPGVLVASTCPPCDSATCFTIASPRPVPPVERARSLDAVEAVERHVRKPTRSIYWRQFDSMALVSACPLIPETETVGNLYHRPKTRQRVA